MEIHTENRDIVEYSFLAILHRVWIGEDERNERNKRKHTKSVSASNAHKSITNDIIKNGGELCLYYSFSCIRPHGNRFRSTSQMKFFFIRFSFSFEFVCGSAVRHQNVFLPRQLHSINELDAIQPTTIIIFHSFFGVFLRLSAIRNENRNAPAAEWNCNFPCVIRAYVALSESHKYSCFRLKGLLSSTAIDIHLWCVHVYDETMGLNESYCIEELPSVSRSSPHTHRLLPERVYSEQQGKCDVFRTFCGDAVRTTMHIRWNFHAQTTTDIEVEHLMWRRQRQRHTISFRFVVREMVSRPQHLNNVDAK